MTIHSSLKLSRGASGQRNVWTRMERILALKKQGRWQDGQKVIGLPKVRTRFKTKVKKKVEEAAAPAAEGAPAAPAPEAAKPAKAEAPARKDKKDKKDGR
jgi:small basic protein (TIGR04137 family)